MRRAAGAGWPMLPRVLAIMLASVISVQFVNFALLQIVPLPPPPVFAVEQVAAALRAGRDPAGDFRFRLASHAPDPQAGRAERLAPAMARELGVGPQAVRLSFVDPPHLTDWAGHGPHPHHHVEDRGSLLVGDFSVALLRPDGRWLVVQPVRSGIAAWRLRLLFWLIAAIGTIIPFAWWLARWVTRPVAIFADAAERIGRDPRTPPLALRGPTEIAHAAAALNAMQQRLNRYVDDRTLMIGAIAHDLRTPLMRMALRLEHAPDALRHGVERDVADMQAMIAAATDYVRGTIRTGARRRIDLRSLAESAVDDLADRGAAASLLPGVEVVVEADPAAMGAAIDNLLANAIRYGGDAEMTVAAGEGCAIIEVRDHGGGLAEEDIERVFEPFFRASVDQSRNRETGGIGLGLASVRAIARQHEGEVRLVNHPDGGLLARLTLPR